MKVKLKPNWREIEDHGHQLTLEKEYTVIGIAADYYRLLNDKDDPVLFPAYIFDIVDHSKPTDWVERIGRHGKKYAYPQKLNEIGFFEDYHDGEPYALKIFEEYKKKVGL